MKTIVGARLENLIALRRRGAAGPVLELSADDFRRQMDINVIGPVIATQAFGPLLGAIITATFAAC